MNSLRVLAKREVLGVDFKVYGDLDNPLFLAKDVATWIDYSDGNVAHMCSMVDKEEVMKIFCNIVENNNCTKPVISAGPANRLFLTEDGLYEILMQSRKPIAKEFKKEVKIIIKDIRKYGIYVAPITIDSIINDPDFAIELLTKYKVEKQATLKVVEEKIPKCSYNIVNML